MPIITSKKFKNLKIPIRCFNGCFNGVSRRKKMKPGLFSFLPRTLFLFNFYFNKNPKILPIHAILRCAYAQKLGPTIRTNDNYQWTTRP